MKISQRVKKILSYYESDCPGTKANLARILMSGRLGGSGHVVILPVDQGFEHGPARSFAPNPAAYDPHYHFRLAVDAGLNAYAAPLGMIEAGADSFAGAIPTILKVNSANSLARDKDGPSQAVTGSVEDALRLGCSAIGFTIYPASDSAYDMIEEIRELSEEAKAAGLAVVVWSYPRGGGLSKEGETAVDIVAYAAHSSNSTRPRRSTRKRASRSEPSPSASAMSSNRRSTGDGWSSSPAARRRASTASMTRSGPSAMAAARARSSAATPSSARATRRWRCSIRSSASTRARPDYHRSPRRRPRRIRLPPLSDYAGAF
jgi:hypothetical protein